MFDDYIGGNDLRVTKIIACHLTTTTFAVATTNENQQTKIYIFDHGLRLVNQLTSTLSSTLVSLACNGSDIYLGLSRSPSSQVQKFQAGSLNSGAVTSYTFLNYNAVALMIFNSKLIATLSNVATNDFGVQVLDPNTLSELTSINSRKIYNIGTSLMYPVVSYGTFNFWLIFCKYARSGKKNLFSA